MKRITTYILIFIAVIIIALFLPFRVIDFYDGDWMDKGNYLRTSYTSGYSVDGAIYLLTSIPLLIVLAVRNRLWICIVSILAFIILLLTHLAISFGITFNLTANDYLLGIGWYISFIAHFVMLIILIVNLVKLAKMAKQNRKQGHSKDLLDDF